MSRRVASCHVMACRGRVLRGPRALACLTPRRREKGALRMLRLGSTKFLPPPARPGTTGMIYIYEIYGLYCIQSSCSFPFIPLRVISCPHFFSDGQRLSVEDSLDGGQLALPHAAASRGDSGFRDSWSTYTV